MKLSKIIESSIPKILLLFLAVAVFTFSSCKDDNILPSDPTGTEKTYVLNAVADPNIKGDVVFAELEDNSIAITITLQGTPDGGSHPAHIHANTAAESGGIEISLEPVDGTTGTSTTIVTTKDDGSSISYTDLIDFDGYINVHLSGMDLATIVAQGDIGQNELTGESKVFILNQKAVAGISGTATFAERANGEALATLSLTGTPDGGEHPAHIHMNTAAEGGGIAFTFNPVNGTTGMSQTNVATLNDGAVFTYADVLSYDGYVNVHLSATDLGTVVAQGDIGQNELTGISITYDLDEKDAPGISGTATFEERANGEALATLALVNTPAGGEHPAHIHMNSADVGGGIALTFTPVNGDTGMSQTNISKLDDDTEFSYAAVLTYNGYINVHLSVSDLGTIVAQGNIGDNAK